jgi:hypothetical protein
MRSGLGFLAAAVLGGGCLQALGYDEPNLVAVGTGGSGGGNAASCSNAKKDGDETGLDCGGTCSPCKDGGGCKVGPDCESHVCTGGACLTAACDDKAKNGDETDVDCGGGTCSKCGPDQACTAGEDCASAKCVAMKCASTCDDGLKDGGETAVDCGGACLPCKNGDACTAGIDCQSGLCKTGLCTDSHVWDKTFSGATAADLVYIFGLAAGSSGNVAIVGSLNGSVDFGGGALTSAGLDAFVAQFDADGKPLWSAHYGDSASQACTAVAIDTAGNTVLTGMFQGSLTINNQITSNGGPIFGDVFIAKLDKLGAPLWTKGFGNMADQRAADVSNDAQGNIYATGTFSGGIDFGGVGLSDPGGGNIYLAKLDGNGNHIWSQGFGGLGPQAGQSIAVDSVGGVVIAGFGDFSSKTTFGGSMLTGAGGTDVFVAKFDTNGNHQWSKLFGDAKDQTSASVAVDSAGNIFVAGTFPGSINFGGATLTSAGGTDIYVAKLTQAGEHIWSSRFGDLSDQGFARIAVDSAGNVLLTGSYQGSVDFGGGSLVSLGGPVGGDDIYVAKLDGSGKHLWSRSFGDSLVQTAKSIAASKNGNVLLSGNFDGILDLGGGPHTNAGGPDAFLVKLLTP